MAMLRRKWPGPHWHPGLDLTSLGLLVVAAIIVKILWADGTLESWVPQPGRAIVRWSAAGLVALGFLLDLIGGVADLRRGVQRGSRHGPDAARGG